MLPWTLKEWLDPVRYTVVPGNVVMAQVPAGFHYSITGGKRNTGAMVIDFTAAFDLDVNQSF